VTEKVVDTAVVPMRSITKFVGPGVSLLRWKLMEPLGATDVLDA
jgi:hypothetical protein